MSPRPHTVDVVANAGDKLRRLCLSPDAPLSDLKKTSPGPERSKTRRNEVAGQRVQYDIDTPAVGRRQYLVREGDRARIHGCNNAELAQHRAFRRRARSRENLGTTSQ